MNILNHREMQIANNVAHGFTNAEIGVKLKLSERTVHWYLSGIYKKLRVNSRNRLINLVLHEYYCKQAGAKLKRFEV